MLGRIFRSKVKFLFLPCQAEFEIRVWGFQGLGFGGKRSVPETETGDTAVTALSVGKF